MKSLVRQTDRKKKKTYRIIQIKCIDINYMQKKYKLDITDDTKVDRYTNRQLERQIQDNRHIRAWIDKLNLFLDMIKNTRLT